MDRLGPPVALTVEPARSATLLHRLEALALVGIVGFAGSNLRSFTAEGKILGAGNPRSEYRPKRGLTMRSEEDIRRRLDRLEAEYDEHDPPASPVEEEHEVALLRAMEELEWVLGERDDEEFT